MCLNSFVVFTLEQVMDTSCITDTRHKMSYSSSNYLVCGSVHSLPGRLAREKSIRKTSRVVRFEGPDPLC